MNRYILVLILTIAFIATSCFKDKFNESPKTENLNPEYAIPLLSTKIVTDKLFILSGWKYPGVAGSIRIKDTIQSIPDISDFSKSAKSLMINVYTQNYTPFDLNTRVVFLDQAENAITDFLINDNVTISPVDTITGKVGENKALLVVNDKYITNLDIAKKVVVEVDISSKSLSSTYVPKPEFQKIDVNIGAVVKLNPSSL
ncbi:MAG: hypothetical protein N4A72_17970 [Bacteroidales bacterium]|jgi:hypothetical protein|nr:hypothetical protein [Bacteroidales bacterium]